MSSASAEAASRTGRSFELSADERAFLFRLIVYGFLVRAVLAFVFDWSGYSTRLAPDEETYGIEGWQMALYWAGDLLVKPWRFTTDTPLAYFYENAAFFYVFGHTVLPIKLLNCLVGAVSCRYVYLLARDLFGTDVAVRTARLYQYFPSLVLWSTLNIRDVWVVFLIVYVSLMSLQVLRGYSHLALVKLLAAMFLLSRFRDYLFYVVALPPIISFLIGRRGNLARNFLLSLAACLAVIVLVQQGVVGHHSQSRMSLEAISQARRDLATGGSAFASDADVSTPGRALAFLPIGIAYYLLSPFPWQITSVLKLFSLPEMLLVYWLIPSLVRGVRYAVTERFRECLQVLLLTGLLTVSYSLGEGNVGTLYRHRAQTIGFYLMLAVAGSQAQRGRRRMAPAA